MKWDWRYLSLSFARGIIEPDRWWIWLCTQAKVGISNDDISCRYNRCHLEARVEFECAVSVGWAQRCWSLKLSILPDKRPPTPSLGHFIASGSSSCTTGYTSGIARNDSSLSALIINDRGSRGNHSSVLVNVLPRSSCFWSEKKCGKIPPSIAEAKLPLLIGDRLTQVSLHCFPFRYTTKVRKEDFQEAYLVIHTQFVSTHCRSSKFKLTRGCLWWMDGGIWISVFEFIQFNLTGRWRVLLSVISM